MSNLTGIKYRRVLIETQQGNMGDVAAQHGLYVVQCKIGKRPPVWKAVAEAEEAAKKRSKEGGFRRRGFACLHRDGGPGQPADKIVAMTGETFAWLIGEHYDDDPEGW